MACFPTEPRLSEGYHWEWNPNYGHYEQVENGKYSVHALIKPTAYKKPNGWYRELE